MSSATLPSGAAAMMTKLFRMTRLKYFCGLIFRKVSVLKKVSRDGGYTGEIFTAKIQDATAAEAEIAKRAGLHKFVIMQKR
jgi:hypothetical protein